MCGGPYGPCSDAAAGAASDSASPEPEAGLFSRAAIEAERARLSAAPQAQCTVFVNHVAPVPGVSTAPETAVVSSCGACQTLSMKMWRHQKCERSLSVDDKLILI